MVILSVILLGTGCFQPSTPPLPSPEVEGSAPSEQLEDQAEDFEIYEEEDVEEEFELLEEDVRGPGATLRGTIKNAKTKKPVPGASVTVTLSTGGRFDALTNGDGHYIFSFPSLPSRITKATFTASREGYRTFTKKLTLKEGKTTTLNVSLKPTYPILKGIVKDKKGRPLEGAIVRLQRGGAVYSTTTDRKGSYLIQDISPGTYTLTVTKSGYRPFSRSVTLGMGKTVVVNIRMGNRAYWTVMVYMAADNNLSPYAVYDLQEMKRVGSTEHLNIVVFRDKGTQAGYYYIHKGWEELVQNLGSINSGKGDSLRHFIQFAKEAYPAERYALILWNHGDGWRSPLRGICFDWSSADGITIPELAQALHQGGVHFDLIGMDACLMAMVEVAYEISNYGKLLVASEGNEPVYGWDYEAFLERLKHSPTMSARALAEEIVNSYFSFYGSGWDLTLSIIDLSKVRDLVGALDNFLGLLRSNAVSQKIRSVSPTRPYIDQNSGYADIYQLTQLLLNQCGSDGGCSPALIQSLQTIQQKLSDVVVKNRTLGSYQGACGLSVYLPTLCPVESSYGNLAFARDTSWDEFLEWWCSGP